MATRDLVPQSIFGNARLITWSGLLNGDDGQPFEAHDFADCSVQFGGTFGAGGTVVWEGSNDGSAYFTLTDVQGSGISKTAAAIEQVAEACRWMRPRVTAGDGSTSMVVTLYCRRSRA